MGARDDAGAAEVLVAITTSVVGLWGYFTFFTSGDTANQTTGAVVLLLSYVANGLVQTALLLLVRACPPVRVRLVLGQLDNPSEPYRPARRNQYGKWLRKVAYFGPVPVTCAVMLVFTPAGTPSGDDGFGIATAILLLSFLGLLAVMIGAVAYFFVVQPFTGIVGAFLPESMGKVDASRTEIISRWWIFVFVAGCGIAMGLTEEVNASAPGQWLVHDLGSPLMPAAVLLLASAVGVITLSVITQRRYRQRSKATGRV